MPRSFADESTPPVALDITACSSFSVRARARLIDIRRQKLPTAAQRDPARQYPVGWQGYAPLLRLIPYADFFAPDGKLPEPDSVPS